MANFVSISLFWCHRAAKIPEFYRFWTSAFTGVTSWRHAEKVARECKTTMHSPSTVSKSFLYSTPSEHNRAHHLTRQQKHFSPPRRRVKSELHQTCVVLDDLEHVIAAEKVFGGRVNSFVSLLGSAENLAVTRPHKLKTTIILEHLSTSIEIKKKKLGLMQCKTAYKLCKFRKNVQ